MDEASKVQVAVRLRPMNKRGEFEHQLLLFR